jgi:hypothetical protein
MIENEFEIKEKKNVLALLHQFRRSARKMGTEDFRM